ncbi:MAG TPA: hypothetical protein PK611_08490 [Saprospiraceae bacterium]|nr:hypothetical protein [Saprospiraceae bacterium]HRO09232.1 hypothetical protein [Saprospiraceae bacterium]HRO73693.1 hypothetical protein [Saprospiraceae bacterium]HRP42594.1 hypothetical protein [Saprospiraceae bacterium]
MRYLLIVSLFLAFTSCKNNSSGTSISADSSASGTQANTTTQTEISKPSFEDAAQYVGKKPSEVELFKKYNLENRLKALLKTDYDTFKEGWNEETPIMKAGEILYFTACKTGSCGTNKYFVMLDMTEPNVNVTFTRGGRAKSYEESAIIGMPDQIADYFEKILGSPGL